ncbi:hypothetical protein AVEN_68965-1 [Araneus ventricosus]|uniref:Uncharacterized protein n=1 Tax=Araneus ventricosus TaxID=182803 RepID=A0A4Y2IEC4_ARAVE|nr:hypothetical protein AVEN_68965-1 [Araneus ventricosus]
MSRRCNDAVSGIVQCCTYFSTAAEVNVDESEPIEISWKRFMFGEENCIFRNPVGRSQVHSWFNCKDLVTSITLILKVLPLLHLYISQGSFDKSFGKRGRVVHALQRLLPVGQLPRFLHC